MSLGLQLALDQQRKVGGAGGSVPVNTIQLVALPANAIGTTTRTIAWGAGWTDVINGVSTFDITVYFNGTPVDEASGIVIANYPGGDVNALSEIMRPSLIGSGPGTYKWGIIVTNAFGSSIEYQTTDSVAT